MSSRLQYHIASIDRDNQHKPGQHGSNKPTTPPSRQITGPKITALLHEIPTTTNSTSPLPTTPTYRRTHNNHIEYITPRRQRRTHRVLVTARNPNTRSHKREWEETPPLPPFPQPLNRKLARAHLLPETAKHPLQTRATAGCHTAYAIVP